MPAVVDLCLNRTLREAIVTWRGTINPATWLADNSAGVVVVLAALWYGFCATNASDLRYCCYWRLPMLLMPGLQQATASLFVGQHC